MKIKRDDFGFKVQSSKFEVQSPKLKIGEFCLWRLKFSRIACFSLILLVLPNFACVNQSLLKQNNVAVIEEKSVSEFDRDLETMKTANFDYIFAFRRKDGGVFDGEDKKFLRANTPPGTNRFIATDENRAFIAGSRYVFSPENLAALRSRFVVEDYSKPESERQPVSQNANTTAKANANQTANINSGQNTKANR